MSLHDFYPPVAPDDFRLGQRAVAQVGRLHRLQGKQYGRQEVEQAGERHHDDDRA